MCKKQGILGNRDQKQKLGNKDKESVLGNWERKQEPGKKEKILGIWTNIKRQEIETKNKKHMNRQGKEPENRDKKQEPESRA